MKRVHLISVVIVVLFSAIFMNCNSTTPPEVAWTKTFVSFYCCEHDNSVRQTSDGGYVFTGCINSGPRMNYDIQLIKTNYEGNLSWNKTFGGPDLDRCYSVQQTSDAGYIMTGQTYSYGAGNSSGILLIKTDSSGNETWGRTFGDGGTGYSVQQTSDGGYIIVGFSFSYGDDDSGICLIKTNSSGNETWHRIWSIPFARCYSVQQTLDGGYVITGYQVPTEVDEPHTEVWLIKTDSSGHETWSKNFGGSLGQYGKSVQQISDGGYIVVGSIIDSVAGNNTDVWLQKTDSSGKAIWKRTFGGSDGNDDGVSVEQTSDGGYIIGGYRHSYEDNPGVKVWLIKTDSSGHETWNKIFDCIHVGPYSSFVQQTSDGGYIVVGCDENSGYLWLTKLAAE